MNLQKKKLCKCWNIFFYKDMFIREEAEVLEEVLEEVEFHIVG